MMQIIDPVRFDAFVQLLAQPDSADLPRRGYIWRCEGDPDRRTTRLPGILSGWLQRRHLLVDVEEPLASARRTVRQRVRPGYPNLRVLRPTGTGGQ